MKGENDMKKNLFYLFLIILGLAAACGVIYGCYWIAKTVSYSIFYEDMIIETVKELVKQSALN